MSTIEFCNNGGIDGIPIPIHVFPVPISLSTIGSIFVPFTWDSRWIQMSIENHIYMVISTLHSAVDLSLKVPKRRTGSQKTPERRSAPVPVQFSLTAMTNDFTLRKLIHIITIMMMSFVYY